MGEVVEDRRAHPRRPVRTRVGCRRLGRAGFDEAVDSIDLSAGGALLLADRRLGVGDVVGLELGVEGTASVGLKGLVVGVRDAPTKGTDARYVHVAFTGLTADRLEALYRVLDSCDEATAS